MPSPTGEQLHTFETDVGCDLSLAARFLVILRTREVRALWY